MQNQPDYITTAEAAKIIGCTHNHATYLASTDKLKKMKRVGHGYLVELASAIEYAENRPKPGPRPKK